jgi:LacI family gluconate utilization system Gnt-I transcriptional repressor
MDTDGQPVDAVVGISHRRAGLMMAQAIVEQGYRRIGFMGTKMPLDHRARKRFEGFTEGLAKAGIEVADREFYSGGSSLGKGREMTKAMLDRRPDLDFLYYSNDMIGAGGLLWCLERGIDVPGRVGLAGFNNIELLDGLPKRLATMDACRRQIGEAAARIVAARAEAAGATAQGGAAPGGPSEGGGERLVLTPTINVGDTLVRG